ncbi:MAG TPA: hypothetical protein VF944_04130, partial [Candidatus Bathyarchaeia archaeon]
MTYPSVSDPYRVSLTVAPWALPGEQIPVGIVVSARRPCQTIVVEWSPGLQLIDKINIALSKEKGRKLRISRLSSGPFDGACYCGIVLAHPAFPSSAVTFGDVKVQVLFKDGTKLESAQITRIGRPFLDLVDRPERVVLRSDIEADLPIRLKYQGFGDIEVRIQAKFKGKIVSHGDSLVYEIARRLLEGESASKVADTASKPMVEVDPNYVRSLVDSVEKLLSSDTPLTSLLEADRVKQF